MSETQQLAEAALKERFGLDSFREGQLGVIESVLGKRDALAVMPTGRGKSLCYQLPAVVNEGIVIVITPLIALMKDQVANLKAKGIPAGCIYSGQTVAEKKEVFSEIAKAKQYLLYLSPERAQKPAFAEWVKKQRISLFAIDEAHCVSQWGPEFRPDYHKLDLLRKVRPDVPILALTATATPPVLRDIVYQLGLRKPDQHIHGFYRPNLYYQVQWCEDEATKFRYLRQALKQTPKGRVLVYCGTRQQCENLSQQLSEEFAEVGFYHAGLKAEERNKIQEGYGSGTIRILIATNAFGMGIDHPDVRAIIHYQMPANIESFYQEMGRAGRDGKESTCLLLYTRKDRGLQVFFIRESTADKKTIDSRWRALETITQFAEGGECRHAGILTYFKDAKRIKHCGHCDICSPESSRKIQAPEIEELSSGEETALPKVAKKKATAKNKKYVETPLSDAAEVRMELLREWRKDYADRNDIPAFLVFSNKALRDLAVRAPKTLSELEKVYGFGPHKVEHLGAEILGILETSRG